jgi:uncharacterized protein YqjF (DUF2071 family)
VARPFLTARWESLLLLNYDCPAALLEPLVPAGTELDLWHGGHVVSLVGFRFLDTRVRGVAIPGHRDFTEVNLRFYVRRHAPDGDLRRAVVFIREVVPHAAIAWTARLIYNEPYATGSMFEDIRLDERSGGRLQYEWRVEAETHGLEARADGPASSLVPGSEAEFITEHYWGYTRQRDGSTLEYRVAHPPWQVWDGLDAAYRAPSGARLYGPDFGEILSRAPRSCFVAVGSTVEVYPGLVTGAD